MKNLIIFLIPLFFIFQSKAQTINLQAGPSISHLNYDLPLLDESIYDEVIVGFAGFVGFDYLETKVFHFSSNLGFIRKGGLEDYRVTDSQGNIIDDRLTFDYISINTTLNLRVPVGKRLRPFISFGPRIDLMVDQNQQIDDLSRDDFNDFSYGFLSGAGIKLDYSPVFLGLRADYYSNFNKIAEIDSPFFDENFSITDKTFHILFILGFSIK